MRDQRCLGVVAASAAAMVLLIGWQPAGAQENPVSADPNKGTKDGSPVDHLPPHIRLLDIQLPDDGQPMRPDWSPDGGRLVLLDAPIGDVWEHDLASGANRNLTGAFLPGGVLRAHHLSNGDLLLCAPAERSADDPEGDRFRGELWVLQRPLGTRAAVRLEERCWEGIAASKHPDSTRIAWNHSTIDFTDFPDVFVEALAGESRILTGRIVYRDGTPTIVDRTVVLDKRDVSPDTPAVEAQDFRSLDDGDADPDDELIFTAYFHKGGQAMGFDLDTGEVTDYAPTSVYYEEAEGVDPAGRYVVVEREQTITLYPGMVDIWRLSLDGSGTFERLTFFNHYRGYGANNPVVSPDGRFIAFSLKVEGEEGEGDGILLLDQRPPAADPPSSGSTSDPAAPGTPPGSGEATGAPLPATGLASALPGLGGVMAIAGLLARSMTRTPSGRARRKWRVGRGGGGRYDFPDVRSR